MDLNKGFDIFLTSQWYYYITFDSRPLRSATNASRSKGEGTLERQYYSQSVPVRRMSWRQAAKQYFAINPRSRFFLMAIAVKLATTLVRLFPALASIVIVADDVTVVGVADDPLLGVTLPMLCVQLVWYGVRVAWVHHRGNRPHI